MTSGLYIDRLTTWIILYYSRFPRSEKGARKWWLSGWEHLLCTHEDLNSIFLHAQNSPGVFACICNSSVTLSGVTEMAEACWPGSLAFRFREKLCLKEITEWWGRAPYHPSLSSAYTRAQASWHVSGTHTHTHVRNLKSKERIENANRKIYCASVWSNLSLREHTGKNWESTCVLPSKTGFREGDNTNG